MSNAGAFTTSGLAPGTVGFLTGNSGGAVPPTANNINTIGAGSITIVGSPGTSTLTTQLTGLTNHSVLLGAGTSTITSLANGVSGQVLTAVTGADPTWSTPVTAISTINGNTGSVTGATVTITGGTSGAVFTGSGTTLTLSFPTLNLNSAGTISIGGSLAISMPGSGNTFVGFTSGNPALSGNNNSAFGNGALDIISSGTNNNAFGLQCLTNLTTGTNNCGLGSAVLGNLGTGNSNTVLGHNAGISYTTNESGNILLNNSGVVGDNNTMRLGSSSITSAFIQGGVVAVTASNPKLVTINSATGQLGSAAFTSGTFTPTITGSVTPGVTTYASQLGTYTVVGNLVFFECYVAWTASTASGNLSITNFPITVGASETAAVPISFNMPPAGASQTIYGVLNTGTTSMSLSSINTTTGVVTNVAATATGAYNFKSFYLSN